MRFNFRSPYLLLTLVPLLWSSNNVIAKYSAGYLPPFTLAIGRFAIAVLILLPWYFKAPRYNLWQDRKLLLQVLVVGLTGVTLFTGLLYLGLHYTTVINSTLINAFSPILIASLAVLWLKEKLVRRQIIGLVISFCGMVWIIAKGDLSNIIRLNFNLGDVIVFGAMLAGTTFSLLSKVVMAKIPPMETTALSMFAGIIFLVPFSVVELGSAPTVYLGWQTWAALIFMGVFSSVLAYYWLLNGVARVGAARASNFYNLNPVFGTVLAMIFLKEKLYIHQIVGGLLIFVGIYFSSKAPSAKKSEPAKIQADLSKPGNRTGA